MAMPKVLYLGPREAWDSAVAVLAPVATIEAPELTREGVAAEIDDAAGILDASMKVRLDRRLLDQASCLRVISTATTGADHIDAITLKERNVPLFTLKGELELLRDLTPAAEHTWALLLAAARRLCSAVRDVLEGHWERERFPGHMLRGKILGIIGCGRIGTWVAKYGDAFGMRVIGYDPLVEPWPQHIERKELAPLLSEADFVTLHVSYSDQVRHMMGAREFSLMKQGAVFVNTSRGALVDEEAFLEALSQRRISAAVDVLEGEPHIQRHPLVEYARAQDNLIITPHVGGFSHEAVKTVVAHAAQRIADVLVSQENVIKCP